MKIEARELGGAFVLMSIGDAPWGAVTLNLDVSPGSSDVKLVWSIDDSWQPPDDYRRSDLPTRVGNVKTDVTYTPQFSGERVEVGQVVEALAWTQVTVTALFMTTLAIAAEMVELCRRIKNLRPLIVAGETAAEVQALLLERLEREGAPHAAE